MPLSAVNVKSTGSGGSVCTLPAGVSLSRVLTRGKTAGRPGCQAVLISVDGVLANTRALRIAAWQQIAEELLFPFSAALGESLPDLPAFEALERLLGPAARDIDLTEKRLMIDRQREHYRLLLETLSPRDVTPGGWEFVASARAAGIKVAALAADVPDLLERVGVANWFDGIFDGDTDATALRVATRSMGAVLPRAVLVSGCESVIRVARFAGMKSVSIGRRHALADLSAGTVKGIAPDTLDQIVDGRDVETGAA